MEMIAKYLYDMGFKGWAIFVTILLIFVEFNPKIKFNPIASILNWFGTRFNSSVEKQISGFKSEVNEKFDKLNERLTAQEENLEQVSTDSKKFELSSIYWDITQFETSILNGEKFYREQYRHAIENGNRYKDLAKELGERPDATQIQEIEEALSTIHKHYDEHRHDSEMMI